MECPAIPGGEYASVQEYAESVTGGNALEKISPLEIVKAMEKYVEAAEELLAKLQEKSETKEFAATLYDIDFIRSSLDVLRGTARGLDSPLPSPPVLLACCMIFCSFRCIWSTLRRSYSFWSSPALCRLWRCS